jgi:hypothetical protein
MSARMWTLGAVAFCGSFLLVAAAGPATAQDDAKARTVEFAGLKGETPKDWEETRILVKECYKRYQLDAIGDIKYNAHVTLYRLDKDMFGPAADAVTWWQKKFVAPQGKTIQDPTRVEKFKIGELQVTLVDIAGTFKGFVDEPDMAYLDFRLIGAYVQTPKGVYLAQLIGPTQVVEFYQKGFEGWLKGLH